MLGWALGVECVSEIGLVLMERDKRIFKEIDRWRVVQGRHIKELVGFEGQRACDRRLRKLIESGYIERKKYLYGVAGVYSNMSMATKKMLPRSVYCKVRLEQIMHDIAVLDTAILQNMT